MLHTNDTYQESGLSKVDLELVEMLEAYIEVQYQNDHDAGYTYIDKALRETGDLFLLTPFMMKEWARATVFVQFHSRELS